MALLANYRARRRTFTSERDSSDAHTAPAGSRRFDRVEMRVYKSIRGTADLDAMTEELCPADPGAIKSC